MRQTLHIIPSSDFPVYISALHQSRTRALLRIMSNYFGITRKDVDTLNKAIIHSLGDGPKTQRELVEEIKPNVGKKLLSYMKLTWSIQIFRSALVEGLICYGPDRGKDTTFVRVDHWLPKRKEISEQEAKRILLRRYLSAYGPATLRDFARWAGYRVSEAMDVWHSIDEEFVEVSVDGNSSWILKDDIKIIEKSEFATPILRLLPAFDSFILGHVNKHHLVDKRYYKKVYRNQGWISSVVLLNGRIIGVWSLKLQSKPSAIELALFAQLSSSVRTLIKQEIKSLEQFLQTPLTIKYVP